MHEKDEIKKRTKKKECRTETKGERKISLTVLRKAVSIKDDCWTAESKESGSAQNNGVLHKTFKGHEATSQQGCVGHGPPKRFLNEKWHRI